MSQEFVIKSPAIEDKINQLLPSQGGFQPGVDFSASTMVIPIVDLTETAEGSSLRQDLQTAFGFEVQQTTLGTSKTSIVATTGYYKVSLSGIVFVSSSSGTFNITLSIDDGTTVKNFYKLSDTFTVSTAQYINAIREEFVIFLSAGNSLVGESDNTANIMNVYTRQIADISGNLVNPL